MEISAAQSLVSIDGHVGRPAWHGPGPAVPGPRLVGPAWAGMGPTQVGPCRAWAGPKRRAVGRALWPTILVSTVGQLLGEEYRQLSGVRGEVAELRDDLATMNALFRM
uniref:Rx N-terminal domain-containing protein n=1 Tax=Oryza rufipogon TaxID=4529 RepID=A0A0E0R2Q3_ORYRU